MSEQQTKCELCGEPMPPGEEMFKYHGFSGPCPKSPMPVAEDESDEEAARPEGSGDSWAPPLRRPVPLATPKQPTPPAMPQPETPDRVKWLVNEMLNLYGITFTDATSREVCVDSWALQFTRALSPPPDVERLTQRPETGPMQFGDDWPGVFVRGDNAGGIVSTLMSVIDLVEKTQPMQAVPLRSIMRLFDSSDVRKKPEVQKAELVAGADPVPVCQ